MLSSKERSYAHMVPRRELPLTGFPSTTTPCWFSITMTSWAWKVIISTGPCSIILPIASCKDKMRERERDCKLLVSTMFYHRQVKPSELLFPKQKEERMRQLEPIRCGIQNAKREATICVLKLELVWKLRCPVNA